MITHVVRKADQGDVEAFPVEESGPPEADMEEDPEGDEAENEARPPRTGRRPCDPTPEEKRMHEVAHLPFRSWCSHCVRGRKKNIMHRPAPEVDGSIRQIGVDFFFLGDDDTHGTVPCVCAKERSTKVHFAYVVPGKGGDEDSAAERLAKDFRNIGFDQSAVIIKGDQEAAISSLLRNIKQRLPAAIEERSPIGEKGSNGDVERGIQSIEDITRTLKLALEEKLHTKIPVTHPLITWLVPHAAFLYTRLHVAVDGRTGYERLKGKQYRGEVLEFGIKTLFRVPGRHRGGSLEPRWDYGIWLGKDTKTDEHILWSGGKVMKSHGVQQLPIEDSWDTKMVDQVRVYQWAPEHEHEERDPIFRKAEPEEKVEEDKPEEPIPRGAMIFRKDLEKFGFTPGCRKCTALLENRSVNPTLGHSPECRQRVLEEMRKDGTARQKVEAAEKRKKEYEDVVEQKKKEATRTTNSGTSSSSSTTRRTTTSSSSSGPHAAPTPSRPATSTATGGSSPSEGPGAQAENRTPQGAEGGKEEDEEQEEDPQSTRETKRRRTSKGPRITRTQTESKTKGDKRAIEEAGPEAKRTRASPETEEASSSSSSSSDSEGSESGERGADAEIGGTFFVGSGADRRPRSGQDGAKRCIKWDVAEFFSPPRITAEAGKHGLIAGCACDMAAECPLTSRKWDFLCAQDRKDAIRMVMREKPAFIVGCPPCAKYCNLLHLSASKDSPEFKRAKAQADILLDFAMELYTIQLRGGRHFIHEHPLTASSWREPSVERMLMMPSVGTVRLDMCAYGMQAVDRTGPAPVMKPTLLMSSSEAVLNRMSRRCCGGHRHAQLVGSGVTSGCAIYPQDFCSEICKCISAETKAQHEEAMMCGSCLVEEDPKDGGYCLLSEGDEIAANHVYVDDRTGEHLDEALVKKARMDEMGYYKKLGVYVTESRKQAFKSGARKIIKVRWVDGNKGTPENPEIRSRLVAKDIATSIRDDLYAATPNIEAFRLLVSLLASRGRGGPGTWRALVVDISRAFMYADVKQPTWVELPEEDPQFGRNMVARLLKAMYGTREAPLAWQEHVEKVLTSLGFKQGVLNPCIYHHPKAGVYLVHHVDDFFAVGAKGSLEWLRGELAREFQHGIKSSLLGPDVGEERSGSYLKRKVTWTSRGLEVESDPQHAANVLASLGLQGCKAIATPGAREEEKGEDADLQHLDPEAHSVFRRAVAIANFLAMDRPDIAFATKLVASRAAAPTQGDLKTLKRLARYLKAKGTSKFRYPWQDRPSTVTTYTDSDWAGDKRSRKSTSGGVVMYGAHYIKHWSKAQQSISLSSAEAELYALIKAGTESIGVRGMARDVGLELEVVLLTDASATKAICMRKGSGRLKHLQVQDLWIQQAVRESVLKVRKIPRSVNLADVLTHHWSHEDGSAHLSGMGFSSAE